MQVRYIWLIILIEYLAYGNSVSTIFNSHVYLCWVQYISLCFVIELYMYNHHLGLITSICQAVDASIIMMLLIRDNYGAIEVCTWYIWYATPANVAQAVPVPCWHMQPSWCDLFYDCCWHYTYILYMILYKLLTMQIEPLWWTINPFQHINYIAEGCHSE